jgi:hypothetical protein
MEVLKSYCKIEQREGMSKGFAMLGLALSSIAASWAISRSLILHPNVQLTVDILCLPANPMILTSICTVAIECAHSVLQEMAAVRL